MKGVLFITWEWDTKVGSQEIPGVTGKFGLGVQNEAGQRLREFYQENHWSQQTPSSNNTREGYTRTSLDGQYQIRLIIIFVAKDGEALYSQQKQDRELPVAQITNSLLPNSYLN